MARVMRRLFLLLFFAASLGMARAEAGAGDAFFDPTFGQLAEELQNALGQGKRGVLLMFAAEACPYCRKMREQVFSRLDVQRFFKRHYTVIAIDVLGSVPLVDFAGRETTEKALAHAFRVRGTPTFVVVGAGGRELARHVGGMDAEAFLAWGRKTLAL